MLAPPPAFKVSMLSYNDAIGGNVVVDPDTVTDAPLFRACYLDELDSLALALGVPVPPSLRTDTAALAALGM